MRAADFFSEDVRTCWSCGDLFVRGWSSDLVCAPCREEGGRPPQQTTINEDTFSALFAAQDGKCAICGATGGLLVDHDHSTGLVRGLLCHRCNVKLGQYHDSTSRLRRSGHPEFAEYVCFPPAQRKGLFMMHAQCITRALSRPAMVQTRRGWAEEQTP